MHHSDKEERVVKNVGLQLNEKLVDLYAASNHSIPIAEKFQNILEGWEGRLRGLWQVLGERG